MLNDLKFSDTVFGLGAGVFFIAYFLFEVPSNVIVHKVGAGLDCPHHDHLGCDFRLLYVRHHADQLLRWNWKRWPAPGPAAPALISHDAIKGRMLELAERHFELLDRFAIR